MRPVLVIASSLLPFAALADESGQLLTRDQCEPLYTVQKRGCVSEHVLRCETPDGVIFRNDLIEDGELRDVEFSDAEFEYVDSWNADGQKFLLEMVENRDPFSLTNLIETQVDNIDQTALADLQIVAPREVEIVATSAMTGDVQLIDGREIAEIAFIGTFDFSTMVWEVSGTIYLDRLTRTLFDGPVDIDIGGFTRTLPGEPVRILTEGDPGFMRDITLFDCGEQG